MVKRLIKSRDELLQSYFKQIKAFPLLSLEEELELSKLIQKGNTTAFHKLINCNLRLVVKIARLYSTSNIPIMDLIQEGNLGLMRAAEKYDHLKNVRFCTYASWWIKQSISRYITNKMRIVRLPLRKEEALRKIQRAYNNLCQTLMRQPMNADIAQELGISVQEVDSIINVTSGMLPFEYNNGEDENIPVMDIHEDYTYCPERTFLKQYSRDGTLRVLNKLKEREKRILSYRYQLNGSDCYTLREIGDEMDISPETVRQIEMKALKKIRSHASELKEFMYCEAM
ncbi:MAG: RNA polymerase sigma factor RpoD/SigA [Treponema sp.]|jgi:RNA polymerase primary sigma factor|nr:RNA polymerase sigma factor RpoD/SigA [Treponema sp.]